MNFDDNQWYHIYVNGDNRTSVFGTHLVFGDPLYGPLNNTLGAVFQTTYLPDEDEPSQKWQIASFDSEYYVLRTQSGGGYGYLSTFHSKGRVELTGSTLANMVRDNYTDDSVFWKISPWRDGTYFLTNKANGTDWNLKFGGKTDNDDGTEAQMTTNTATVQPKQRISFEPIGEINNEKFSRSAISLAAATLSGLQSSTQLPSQSSTQTGSQTGSQISTPTSTSGTANPSDSASTPATSSGGLSTGAKAGIGASVGGAALIALVVLGLFFFRRRKQRAASPTESTNPHAQGYSGDMGDGTATKYGYFAFAGKPELDAHMQRQELPSMVPEPAELSGGEHSRQELSGGDSNR